MASDRRILAALMLVMLVISGCAKAPESDPESGEGAATLEPIEGTELNRVTLTERAAERLDIQTTQVVDAAADGRTMVPYAAVVYDAEGVAWVYVNTDPLVFERAEIDVRRIEGDDAVLSVGPAAGTEVVTVGAAELLGAEFEIGH
jgi:hypothetical protein